MANTFNNSERISQDPEVSTPIEKLQITMAITSLFIAFVGAYTLGKITRTCIRVRK